MILVDANILMYASGAEHANKAPSVAFLTRVAEGKVEASIDAEVLQEIIHRYRSLNRWPQGRQVYLLSRNLFPDVFGITGRVLDQANELVDKHQTLSARDAVHAAVVLEYKLEGICTFDKDFDQIRGCKRINPLRA